MKIETKNVKNTIETIAKQNNFKAVLLYGEDNSSVSKNYKTILDLFIKENYEINDISQEKLKENKTILVENFFSISMFSTNTAYTLRLLERENDFTEYLKNLFEKNDTSAVNNFLIITANGLGIKSSLRQYAEKSKYIACIGCYEEDARNIITLINDKLKEYNFKYNNDVVLYISKNVGNNNLIIKNEIDKIFLYKGKDKNLTLEDVKNCITDIAESKIEDFCNDFCLFNKNNIFRNLHKIFDQNIELIIVIRSLVKYFLQLQKIKFLTSNGKYIDDVLKAEKIFWKQHDNIKNALQKWNLEQINKFLEMLLNIEKTAKFSQNKNIEFENFIMKSLSLFNK